MYLFTGDNGRTQYFDKTLRWLKSSPYSALTDAVVTYTKYVLGLYGIPENQFGSFAAKHVQLVLLRYNARTGIWPHIDNVARYDQGPIVTISIGPEVVLYDMLPTLLCKDPRSKPLRFAVHQGQVVVLDGSARMEWAHALPFGVPQNNTTKYTIMLKCDHFARINPIRNPILQTDISTSGILC